MGDHSQTEGSSINAYRSTRGDGAGVAAAPLHSGPAKGSESTPGWVPSPSVVLICDGVCVSGERYT